MTARVHVSQLEKVSPEYAADVLKEARREGDYLLMPLTKAAKLRAKHNPPARVKIRGLGDIVHMVAKPIAKVLGMGCIDKKSGELKPQSPCAKRREQWNRALPIKKG